MIDRGLFSDTETNVVEECYAVIYTPRRKRDRFPENCVHRYDSAEAAIAAADPDKGLYPAKVMGPARSSEGFMLYYLVDWLD